MQSRKCSTLLHIVCLQRRAVARLKAVLRRCVLFLIFPYDVRVSTVYTVCSTCTVNVLVCLVSVHIHLCMY